MVELLFSIGFLVVVVYAALLTIADIRRDKKS